MRWSAETRSRSDNLWLLQEYCLHLNSMRHMFIRYGRETPRRKNTLFHISAPCYCGSCASTCAPPTWRTTCVRKHFCGSYKFFAQITAFATLSVLNFLCSECATTCCMKPTDKRKRWWVWTGNSKSPAMRPVQIHARWPLKSRTNCKECFRSCPLAFAPS